MTIEALQDAIYSIEDAIDALRDDIDSDRDVSCLESIKFALERRVDEALERQQAEDAREDAALEREYWRSVL